MMWFWTLLAPSYLSQHVIVSYWALILIPIRSVLKFYEEWKNYMLPIQLIILVMRECTTWDTWQIGVGTMGSDGLGSGYYLVNIS